MVMTRYVNKLYLLRQSVMVQYLLDIIIIYDRVLGLKERPDTPHQVTSLHTYICIQFNMHTT